MFSNMGRKIRVLAQIVMWVGISLCILGGLALALLGKETYFVIAGITVAVAGSLISWITGFLLCGYGELIQANTDMLSVIREMKNDLHIVRVLDETAAKTAIEHSQPINTPQSVNQPQQYSHVVAVNPQIKPEYAAQQEEQLRAQAQNAAMANNSLQQPIKRTVYYVETATSSLPKNPPPVQMPKPTPRPVQSESITDQAINVGKVKKIEHRVEEIAH